MGEPFWRDDPSVLINPRYLHRFFPSPNLTTPEKMNAIVRLGAYIGVGLAIVQKTMTWILLPVIAAVITMSWDVYAGESGESANTNKRLSRRARALRFLAEEVLSGRTRNREHRHHFRNPKKLRGEQKKRFRKELYNDLDTNLQNIRNERAHLMRRIDKGIGDAPGFARKMMRRDRERYRVNGRKKYSRE